jgi:muconolactone delta-isomerase
MRFLVVTKGRDPLPPEMAIPMLQMFQGWLAEHRASGKLEEAWSFAGQVGGGGIANVDSLEELDAIMATYPFSQTSDIEVYPLADIDAVLETSLANIQGIMEAMSS